MKEYQDKAAERGKKRTKSSLEEGQTGAPTTTTCRAAAVATEREQAALKTIDSARVDNKMKARQMVNIRKIQKTKTGSGKGRRETSERHSKNRKRAC